MLKSYSCLAQESPYGSRLVCGFLPSSAFKAHSQQLLILRPLVIHIQSWYDPSFRISVKLFLRKRLNRISSLILRELAFVRIDLLPRKGQRAFSRESKIRLVLKEFY
jgi:hypothetical protein